jgi:hypothetical protein
VVQEPLSARDILLALCAGGNDAAQALDLTRLDQAQWEWLERRAQDYRLLPLLHSLLKAVPGGGVPESLLETCLTEHRNSVFKSLIMQHALVEIGGVLDKAGIAYAALKGGSLSLEFYSEPALRPMRDLDVLVAPEDAERAYGLLKEAGYVRLPGKADHGMEYAHHLPILVSPKGVPVELHHRIAPREWSGSLALGEQLLANARAVDFQGHTIRMAHPSDTMLHLTVHACLQHLFDNGPNLLSDLRILDESGLLNWDDIHAFAAKHDLTQSLVLIGALYARFGGRGLDEAKSEAEVPEAVLQQAADLMTQDPELHWQRHLLRRRRSVWQRLSEGLGRALKPTDKDLVEIAKTDVKGIAALRYYPQWLWTKGRVYLGAEFRRELDQEAAGDAQLERWLKRPAFADDREG